MVGLVQPADQQCGRHVVGEVGDDPPRRRPECGEIDLQGVGFDEFEPAAGDRLQLLQGANGSRIDLDRDNALGAFEQQGARQPTRTGTDLDHQALIEGRGGAGDAPGEIEVEEEMLTQPLARIEAMGRDDLAQRRQTGEAVHGGAGQDRRRRAMSSAMRSPAIRLVGSARPVPTISSAVPWSGEVRTKGRPSVTLTPPAKSTVLIGISAWS